MRDRGFLHLGLTPPPVGVAVVRLPDLWTGAEIVSFTIEALRNIEPADVTGQVTVLEPGRIRRRPLMRRV